MTKTNIESYLDERSRLNFYTLAVIGNFNKYKKLSYKNKCNLILGGFFELKTAEILERMKKKKMVLNWTPTDKDQLLDQLGVDFVILLKNKYLVGLQITSSYNHLIKRQKKIKDKFGRSIIPSVRLLSYTGKLLTDEKIEDYILYEIFKPRTFFIKI